MLKAGIREFFAESEEIMRKERRWKKVLSALVLAAAMGVTAVGCGTSGGNTGSQPQGENAAATETAEVSDDIVNIGCDQYTWNVKSAFDGWRRDQ